MVDSAIQKQSLDPHDRYVYKPYPGSSHSWALHRLHNLPSETRLLDIGPGSGVMGQILRDQGVQHRSAVEIDEAARQYVAPFYTQVEAELEPFREQQFDLILLLDVLEHMADPFAFLSQLSAMLAPGGSILISVPNVAHWSVRFPLLFGYFKYQERGIMDRTHLQFFTRKRVHELVNTLPNCAIADFTASIEPLELLLPRWIYEGALFSALRKARIAIAHYLPGLMAYQHLVHIKRNR